MSDRLHWAAVLLVAACLPGLVSAKPPDLPLKTTVNCAAPAAAKPGPGTVLPLGIAVGASAAAGCVSADDDAPGCTCEECKCCGCKKSPADQPDGKCTCEDCCCCGCKVVDTQHVCARKVCCTSACSGHGCTGKVGCASPCSACAPQGDCSTFCWVVVESMFPPLTICRFCPPVEKHVRKVVEPCLESFACKCREMWTRTGAGKHAAGCGKECSKQAKTKSSHHTCGQCSDPEGKVKVWHVQVCPFPGTKTGAIRFVWKNGEKVPADKPADAAETPVKSKFTCPYMQKKAQEKEKQGEPVGKLGTPLENLAKLEKARMLCRKAEFLCKAGHYDQAIQCWEKVMQLCPGSRWEVQAKEAIQVAQSQQAVQEATRNAVGAIVQRMREQMVEQARQAATEEAEPVKPPKPCEPVEDPATGNDCVKNFKEKFSGLLHQAQCAVEAGSFEEAIELARQAAALPSPEIEQQVMDLVEKARCAFAAGCGDEAWHLVNQALSLDPWSPAAQTMQAELMRHQQQCPRFRCPGLPYHEEDYDDEPCEEPCEPVDPCVPEPCQPCPGVGLEHWLPALDPAILAGMEKVLRDVGEPCRWIEEIDRGTCLEQEERFFIDPDDTILELIKQDWDTHWCTMGRSLQDAAGKLREVVDVIEKKFGIDCDVTKSGAVRAQVEIEVGDVKYSVMLDSSSGNFTCQIHRGMGSPQDFRDWQMAHNEEVLEWIESMNSGGNTDDGDVEESEEPFYQLETDLGPWWHR